MASSTATCTTNHLDIHDNQQSMSLEEIYDNLKNIFTKANFGIFQKECERAAFALEKHPNTLYCPLKFNSS